MSGLNWRNCADGFCTVCPCHAEVEGRDFDIIFDSIADDDDPAKYMLTVYDFVTPVEGEEEGYGVVVFSAGLSSLDDARTTAEAWAIGEGLI